jgi:hypothetical protein
MGLDGSLISRGIQFFIAFRSLNTVLENFKKILPNLCMYARNKVLSKLSMLN